MANEEGIQRGITQDFNPFSTESLDFQLLETSLKCIVGIVGIATAFLAGVETRGVLSGLPFGEASRQIIEKIQDEIKDMWWQKK